MKTISNYVAAAALAIGGMAFVGCDKESASTTSSSSGTATVDTRTTGEKVGDNVGAAVDKTKEVAKKAGDEIGGAAQTAGSSIKNAAGGLTGSNATRVPNLISDVTEAALTRDGLDDVVERFVDADRNRISQGDLKNGNEALNTLVAQIATDWKAKYNTDFDIHDEANVFGSTFMSTNVGELGKNAGGVKVDVDTDRKIGGGTETKVDVDRKSGVDNPNSTTADTNLNDPGRNVARVTIMASHGAPSLSVPLIHEAGGWKIDVPDTLDAAKLRSNLLAHLTKVQSMKSEWPASADDAYRAVSHHVLMALMDQPAQ